MSETEKPKFSRISRVWRPLLIIVAGSLLVVMAGLSIISGVTVWQCVHSTPEMESASVASRILVLNHATLAGNGGTRYTHGAPTAHAVNLPTSGTLLNPASGSLKFMPWIIDAPDLPQAVRRQKDPINTRFDALLQRVEQYERNKAGMSYEQAQGSIEAIWKEFPQLELEVSRLSITGDAVTPFVIRDNDFVFWYYKSLLENNIRNKRDGLLLAQISANALGAERRAWQVRLVTPEGFVDPTRKEYDFYREGGEQSWRRTVKYYWMARDCDYENYVGIAWMLYERAKERVENARRH